MTHRETEFKSVEDDRTTETTIPKPKVERFQQRSLTGKYKKPPIKSTVSKPANSVLLKPKTIKTHFAWALAVTILCFFLIGPFWALYRSIQIRRMIREGDIDAAERLSNRVSSILVTLTIFGAFVWVAILFCTVGLLLTGGLIVSGAI